MVGLVTQEVFRRHHTGEREIEPRWWTVLSTVGTFLGNQSQGREVIIVEKLQCLSYDVGSLEPNGQRKDETTGRG